MTNHSHDIVKSAEVINVKVKDHEKKNIGKIEEIVLHKLSGQTLYVVLSFGGILGMGEKYFAFPWKSISYSPEDQSFVLNVSKEKLKSAPGFDKNNWPNMAQHEWANLIDAYYN